MFCNLNMKNCKILDMETEGYWKEQLLQIQCPNGCVIGAGWDEGEGEGYFCTKVIQNGNWGRPFYQIEALYPEVMKKHIQGFIDYETMELEETILLLFQEMKTIIESHSNLSYAFCYTKARSILWKLHDVGLTREVVENYIGTYALQFRDYDELKWEFACDILDIVVGYCVPQDYVWCDESSNERM